MQTAGPKWVVPPAVKFAALPARSAPAMVIHATARPRIMALAPPPALLAARRAVQAKMAGQPRIYPNLNAAAAIPVDRNEIFRLNSFFDTYRIRRGGDHGQIAPNSKYVFVRMTTGETLLHPRHRHPVLADGRPVLYAGEVSFSNGKLDWWSNGSGNYRPDAGHAEQAELPMERFYTYEQILKGVHKQTTPAERRAGGA